MLWNLIQKNTQAVKKCCEKSEIQSGHQQMAVVVG